MYDGEAVVLGLAWLWELESHVILGITWFVIPTEAIKLKMNDSDKSRRERNYKGGDKSKSIQSIRFLFRFLFYIIIIIIILLIIIVIKVKLKIYKWQRATVSVVFDGSSDVDQTVMSS
jgi:hypothetical protein